MRHNHFAVSTKREETENALAAKLFGQAAQIYHYHAHLWLFSLQHHHSFIHYSIALNRRQRLNSVHQFGANFQRLQATSAFNSKSC